MFVRMSEFLSEARFGKWEIKHIQLSNWNNGLVECSLYSDDLKARKNIGEMGDSDWDFNECKNFIDYAISDSKNKILIFGLGLGCVPFYLQDKVKRIDVVEIDQDLIDHIGIRVPFSNVVKIYQGDAYTFDDKNEKYEAIFVDISSGADESLNKILSQTWDKALEAGGKIFYWGVQ